MHAAQTPSSPSPASNKGTAAAGAGYGNADELIADLRSLEDALIESGAPDLGEDLVRPVRRAVEIFRFRTVRLDLRENTTRLTANLAGAVAGVRWPEG